VHAILESIATPVLSRGFDAKKRFPFLIFILFKIHTYISFYCKEENEKAFFVSPSFFGPKEERSQPAAART